MLGGAGAGWGAVVVVFDLLEAVPGGPAGPVAEVVDEGENVMTLRADEDPAGDAGLPGKEEGQDAENEGEGAEADANSVHAG